MGTGYQSDFRHFTLFLLAGLMLGGASHCGSADADATKSGEVCPHDTTGLAPAGYLEDASLSFTTPPKSWEGDRWPDRWQPNTQTSWQWQLQGEINPAYDVDAYDIDLMDASLSTIQALRQDGKKIVCYFSAGSAEDWRDDYDQFPAGSRGYSLDGWPGEFWVDYRLEKVWQIMLNRLDLAVAKNCDAVEPDNIQGYAENTCLKLSADDQLRYNRALADAARQRGLAVALKNDGPQVAQLIDWFDLALTEECHQYGECAPYSLFIEEGKPVWNAEYAPEYRNDPAVRQELCQNAGEKQFQTLILPPDLDDTFRLTCAD